MHLIHPQMKLLSRPPPDLKLGRLHLRPGRQVYYINIYFIIYYTIYIHIYIYTSTTTWPPGTPSMLASSWDAALLESFSSKFFIQNIKSDHFAHFPKNLCPRKFPKNFSKNFCPKTFLKAGNRGSSLLRAQPWSSPGEIAIQDRAHDDDLSITWPSFGLFRTQPGQIRN